MSIDTRVYSKILLILGSIDTRVYSKEARLLLWSIVTANASVSHKPIVTATPLRRSNRPSTPATLF